MPDNFNTHFVDVSLIIELHAHTHVVTSRTTINLIVLERIAKLSELLSDPFVFVYTIKYVQFDY